jgi:hypothetical protein
MRIRNRKEKMKRQRGEKEVREMRWKRRGKKGR